ncbi:MAG: ThiF family adenylyltransferase [Saprospiraceae bacterium]|nr:ThiF family adenylyltransferase [Saprospiraceae bacterium]
MNQSKIRVKRFYQLLRHEGNFDFIKTLDEGIKLPVQAFSECFLKHLLETNDEHLLSKNVAEELGIQPADVQGFVENMLEMGVLERFVEPDTQKFERYDRQLLFWDTMQPVTEYQESCLRQERVSKAHVAVIGIGGIGNYFALSLAASGIGKMSLVDSDTVETSNLSRQILFSAADIGQPKAEAAKHRLLLTNPACQIEPYIGMIDSKSALRSLLERIAPVDYLILSADQAVELPLWASDLRKEFNFKAVKCGYMGYQGLIGPFFGPDTPGYDELFQSWAGLIASQDETVKGYHARHAAPASSASNAIFANIACLEVLKDLSGTGHVNLMGKRLLFNLKTLEMRWG